MEQESALKWYYYRSGSSHGLFSQHDLLKLLENKTISPDIYVWRDEMGTWKPASEILYQETISPEPTYPDRETPVTIPKTVEQSDTCPVILVILFTVLTLGIYIPGWFLLRRSMLNSMQSQTKLGKKIFIFSMVMYSICCVVLIPASVTLESIAFREGKSSYLILSELLYRLDSLFSVIVGVIIIYQCFKVRRIILDHADSCFGASMKCNRFLTFILYIFYLQFKINRLLSDQPTVSHNST